MEISKCQSDEADQDYADTADEADDDNISTTGESMDSIRKIGDITIRMESGRIGEMRNARGTGTGAAHEGTLKVSEELLKGSAKSLRPRYSQLIVIRVTGR